MFSFFFICSFHYNWKFIHMSSIWIDVENIMIIFSIWSIVCMLNLHDMWMICNQKHSSCSKKSQNLYSWSKSVWWKSFLLCINLDAAWAHCDLMISHLLVFKLMNLLFIIFFSHVLLFAVQLFFLTWRSDFISFSLIAFVFCQW